MLRRLLVPTLLLASTTIASADTTPQTLPFSENWTDVTRLTNDNWTNVPGIIGYRGDNLTTATNVDVQTVVADGSSTPIDVIVGVTNPNTQSEGGVIEYELANPTIALHPSGTADAPHIVMTLNTTGVTSVRVRYTVRDLETNSDNAAQQVALQYRVGTSGDYTNVPAAYIADATITGATAGPDIPVDVTLPAAAGNQAVVQIRVITANAQGNDESVGIDDIQITAATTPTPTNPSATGAATPASVVAGGTTLLTAVVTAGTNPASTGVTVTCDLTSIGGSATQALADGGANGDATANDGTFSFNATVPGATAAGATTLPCTVADAQTRSSNFSIALTVTAPATPTDPTAVGTATPAIVAPGASVTLTAATTPGTNPASTGLEVACDLSSIGGDGATIFADDGQNGDATAADGTFTFVQTVGATVTDGAKTFDCVVADAQSRESDFTIALTVMSAPPTPVCGNGVVEGTEVCDDGNTTIGDGCSATCTEETGYDCTTASPSVCTDINECTLNTDNCAATGSTCTNTPGSFTCACTTGYEGNGVTCTDLDECTLNTDNCAATGSTCTNTPGSFTCACTTGYEGTGVVCTDIDECTTATDNCDDNASCTNTPGSFACACENGFSGDGVTCMDVDECSNGTETCSDNASCMNTGGAFSCMCNAGYTGDGMSCDPVCGDGIRVGNESCDDANAFDGDGCSDSCSIEPGYTCSGTPSTCTETTDPTNPDDGDGGGCCSTSGGGASGSFMLGLGVLALLRRRRR